MKFITDSMLGKLTRWLRMLGYDTKYTVNLDDKTLIELARVEGRVLLTRDVELCRLATGRRLSNLLVEGKSGAERLAALSRAFEIKLKLDPNSSRCPKCNGRIKSINKNLISQSIPSATARFFDEFWKCLDCGKIYWKGSHWRRIIETLEKAREYKDSL
ncbi:MAG: Mut7-C RNAse domain-containing protein [Candidatus Bathyarchaeota archaeon]|nr:Mut7-C RNAse domain-containing protein [Candidatus Bathyarchaeota archaeon]